MLFDQLRRPPSIWYCEDRDIIGIFAVSSCGQGAMVVGMRDLDPGDTAFSIERLASLNPEALGWEYICEFYDDYN